MKTNQVHFVLQGKGGVGKSLVSAILAQYFASRTGDVRPFDTDPVNDTLSQYKGFSTKRINILDEDTNTIDARVFDELMEDLLSTDSVCVVDNGASTFVPMMAYLVENKAVEVLRQTGKEVYIHSVLTGGQAFDDTLQGLSLMLETQQAPVVVWLNEFFGPVSRDGKTFADSGLYKDYKDRIRGVVRVEKGNADTFGKDMELLGKNKMTFDEALSSPSFGIMPRQRLKMVRDGIYSQLDAIQF